MAASVRCIARLQFCWLIYIPQLEDSRVYLDDILRQLELLYHELSALDAVVELGTQGAASAFMFIAQAKFT